MSDLRHARWILALPLLLALSATLAQDASEEAGGASAEVEESDEAYRRRMELEDARQRDLGYSLPDETYVQKQEKLDKLPEESRDNIRDQLVDIIVENGDWEPSDALKEYPYEPTAAARADPALMQQEQEAWEEQIEKYHRREAAAFGTYIGPVPGPGNPDGDEGGGEDASPGGSPSQSAGEQGQGQQGSGQQAGSTGGQEGDPADATAGTYEPYQSQRGQAEEEVSTAGVQQSALDFLKGLEGQGPAMPPSPTASDAGDGVQAAEPPRAASAAAESGQPVSEAAVQADRDNPSELATEIGINTPGIIPIEDLDKLEGVEAPPITPESGQP
jgi:hypothetical protein